MALFKHLLNKAASPLEHRQGRLRTRRGAALLLAVAAGATIVGAAGEAWAVRGFAERTLALPAGARKGAFPSFCDVWAPGGAKAAAPTTAPARNAIMLCHYETNEGAGAGLAMWELGSRLRKTVAPLPPSSVLYPDPDALGIGRIRYCLGRLAAGEGPSILFATGQGVIAYPSIAGKPGAQGKLIDTKGWLALTRAAFPSAETKRNTIVVLPAVFAMDLNGDGKDELVLPGKDGASWTAYGGGAGSYSRSAPLPASLPATDFAFAADSPPLPGGKGLPPRRAVEFFDTQTSRIDFADANRDGRLDVLAIRRLQDDERKANAANGTPPNDLRMDVFLQRPDGSFATTQPAQTVFFRQKDTRREWRDINGDGLMDLVELRGNFDLVAPLMLIDLYLATGPVTDVRDARPTRSFPPRNPFGIVLLGDWDGDGDVDLAHTEIDRQFGSAQDMVKMMVNEDLDVGVKFYAFDKGAPPTGKYPMRPTCQTTMKIQVECLSSNYPSEIMMQVVDDLTGDGLPDLVVRRRRDILSVYELNLAKGAVARSPAVEFAVPEMAFPGVADLDGDGKADVYWFDPEKNAVVCELRQ